MNKNAIIITVGTSLFHSATWQWQDKPKFMDNAEWASYQNDFLSSGGTGGLWFPEKRKMRGELVDLCLRANLKAKDAAAWEPAVADYLGGDPTKSRRRYSAEITSLLAFAEKFNEGVGWQNFLKGADIFFACDETSPTTDCAEHLRYISRKLSGGDLHKIHHKPLPGFSAQEPDELLRGLDKFDELVWQLIDSSKKYDEIQIIVSGGYKVYAIQALNHLPTGRLKVHYMHEEADVIFTHSLDSQKQDSNCLPISIEAL